MTDASNIPFAPAPAPGADSALVYLSRAGGTHGGGWAPMVSVDGKPVFHFRLSEYSAIYVKPGRHSIEFDGKPAGLEFEARGGATYVVSYLLPYSHTPTIGIATPAGLLFVPAGQKRVLSGGWIFVEEDPATPSYMAQLKTLYYRRSETPEYLSPADRGRYGSRP